MKTETPREIAERIAKEFRPRFVKANTDSQRLANAIEQLIVARDERAEKERPILTESEVQVLTDYHYYEAEKAITRRGDHARRRYHLERLAAIRGKD